jgi:hypothetical protein
LTFLGFRIRQIRAICGIRMARSFQKVALTLQKAPSTPVTAIIPADEPKDICEGDSDSDQKLEQTN